MIYETKYGVLKIIEENNEFCVVSDIPFLEKKEKFENIEEAYDYFKKLKKEIDSMIKKIEEKKSYKLTTTTSLYKKLHQLVSFGFKKILLYGPTGTGKTFSIINLLKNLKDEGKIDDYYIFTFSSGIEDMDLLGKYILTKKKTLRFKESLLLKAIKRAKEQKIAIVFDEFNRASPKALNVLIPLLDGRENKCVLDNYLKSEKIEAPEENILFFFTANFGGGYTGTFSIDDAILNRIDVSLFVDYQKEIEENIINDLEDDEKIKIIKELKDYFRDLYKEGVINPFSTRDLKNIVKLYKTSKKDKLFESIEPIIYKLVKTDNFGFPDISVIEDIRKFCENLVEKY